MPPSDAAKAAPTDIRTFQMRFLQGLLLVSAGLCGLFLLLNSLGRIPLQPEQRVFAAAIALAFSAMALVLRRHAKAYVPLALAMCLLAFLIFVQALMVAQINELRVVWFFMTLGAAYILLGPTGGLAMALCTMVVVWGTNGLHAQPYSRQALLVYSAVMLVMCFGYHSLIGYALGLYRHVLRREALFRMLTEDSSEVVWRTDRHNVLTYVSPADERMRGFPAHDVLGRPAEAMFTEEGARLLRAAMEAGATQFVAPVQHRDGTERWIEVITERELDAAGNLVGRHGRSRDVTERLRLEAEVRRHRANLEGLVQERTADLSVAKEVAEAAVRAKNIFLSNISHELRTPLTVILGMSELARARVAEPRSQQLLDRVLVQARKLTALITDLIDYAALGAKRMQLKYSPFLLAPVLHNVQAALAEAAARKGLALTLEIPVAVAETPWLGDVRRLQQVLMQLADNAIKFTERGHVTIRVLAPIAEPGTDTVQLEFEIEDTGIGIEPTSQWALFNAFEQADGTATRTHEGTGLGLALCKLLVQAMGGKIGVTSQPALGSIFHFSVALGIAPPLTDPQPPATDLRRPVAAGGTATGMA